jgi:endonuclease III
VIYHDFDLIFYYLTSNLIIFLSQQGVPIDIHLLAIFRRLRWIANEDGQECAFVAQASIEGWFPKRKWGELNQVYAGLGQLFRERVRGAAFLQFATDKCTSEDHPYSCEDHERVEDIARYYKLIP